MLNKIIYMLFLIPFLVLMGTMTMSEEYEPGRPSVFDFAIKKSELPSLEEKALDGDPEAARRLYAFYDILLIDKESSLYWARIAAENGSIGGMYSLGFTLSEDPDPKNRRRAIFWLKRVAQSDDKELADAASFILEDIASKEGPDKLISGSSTEDPSTSSGQAED